MLYTLLLIIATTSGGFALTYLFASGKRFLWRLAAGNVIGSAVFGTVLFLSAMLLGFEVPAIMVALAITILPTAIFLLSPKKAELRQDWAVAKGRLSGAGLVRLSSFAYYAIAAIFFAVFFGRAMFQTADGIFTGASQNLGDLPFHLGIIFSFTDGANFPPMNPNFSGVKLAYPFIADLITAAAVKLGSNVRDSMLAESAIGAFSLLVLLESFVFDLFKSRPAARLGPLIFFLSGGFGFWIFMTQAASSDAGFFSFLGNLPRDYTIGDDYRWGNPLTTLLITQRSLLLGLPLALIAIDYLKRRLLIGFRHDPIADLIAGLLTGTLVLIHVHSLFVLFIIGATWTLLRPKQIKSALIFAAGTAAIALPEILWTLSGTASNASEFLSLHLWWDSRGENPMVFWLRNTGLTIPLTIFGLFLAYRGNFSPRKIEKSASAKTTDRNPAPVIAKKAAIEFYLPFFLLFILGNVFKFAPWEWDNIKILIYWFLGSVPFIAYAIATVFRISFFGAIAAVALFAALVFSGSLDVWRTISGQINIKVFSREAVEAAQRIRAVTPKNAIIANAATYNSVIVLTGRQSLMRYPGHLSSHGIDYIEREADLKAIYAGGPLARHLLQKYNVDFVLISPEERSMLQINDRFFADFPVSAAIGDYKLYKVH